MMGDPVLGKRIRGASEGVVAGTKELRRELTPAECLLWTVLRGRQLGGLRFRCQHPVGPFVLDFYCPAAKLVIEVDGGVHEQQHEQDAARTEHLQQYGYRVLRFTNREVFDELDGVIERILLAASDSSVTDRVRQKRMKANLHTCAEEVSDGKSQ
jgi:very-short-patch-repair endonuclease